MHGGSDKVWRWSSQFSKAVAGRRRGLPGQERLSVLRWQIEAARCLFREGYAEPLLALYGYWRSEAGADVRAQIRFAVKDLTTSRRLFVSATRALCVH
jgi:hypothetical protein